MTHRDALQQIVKICSESSDFSRRTQACLNTALIALGYTASQRADCFTKAAQRSELFKEQLKTKSKSEAKKVIAEAVFKDTGEVRQNIKKQALEEYV